MGAFNILETDFYCPKCRYTLKTEVEFKVGHLNQDTYHIGDKLRFRDPTKLSVIIDSVTQFFDGAGYVECSNCQQDYFLDIVIENDIIVPPEIESSGWRKE